MLNHARKYFGFLAIILTPLGGNANDQAIKQARKPPILSTTEIVEVHNAGSCEGSIVIETGDAPFEKTIPGGNAASSVRSTIMDTHLEVVVGHEADEINSYLNSIAGGTSFSGVVFIKRGDQILLSKGYGDARQADTGRASIPNTPSTLFHIGSITKQLTAGAVMKLAEDGKIGIGGNVNDYLPDEYRSALWGDATVKQLLSHTSGLGNYLETPDYLIKCQDPDFNVDSIIKEAMQQKALPYSAGEFHYSNTGYLLLGAVIEKTSGKSYGEFMREFFEKAGMHEAGVHDDTFDPGPDMAIGYRVEESGKRLEEDLSEDLARTCGADGNVYSSVYDLSRWNDILDCEENILKPESLKEMMSPVENGYGYGIMTGKIFGRTKIFHNGRVPGFICSFYKFPQEGMLESLFIAVLGNNGSFSTKVVADYIAQFLLTEK